MTPRRLQFSLRTALTLVFVIALIAWPTSNWLRTYLANRGLVPVTGRVIFKGQPVGDAKVTLAPVAGGRPIAGMTNLEGKYELERLVKPGEYTVSIAETGTKWSRLPPRYGDASVSGLRVFVTAVEQNHIEFALSE